jgi:hypothetical protein
MPAPMVPVIPTFDFQIENRAADGISPRAATSVRRRF